MDWCRLFAFIIARFTPQMFLAMSYGVYLFFATFMILSIAFVYVSYLFILLEVPAASLGTI